VVDVSCEGLEEGREADRVDEFGAEDDGVGFDIDG
jgi:hypothetical protein